MKVLESAAEGTGSQLLQSLVTPGGRFPDLQEPLQQLAAATDWDAACQTGQIVPAQVGGALQRPQHMTFPVSVSPCRPGSAGML